MGSTTAGVLFALSMVGALVAVHVPLGDYMYRLFTTTRHWKVERGIYRLVGVDPDAEQAWPGYARSVLALSAVSVLFLYGFQRVQHYLLLGLGLPNLRPDTASYTPVSF